MASGTNKNVARIALIAVLVPITIAIWFAAPIFLPIYRWLHINPAVIARATGKPEKAVATIYKFRLVYNPRGEGDPVPWQIINSDPPFGTVYPGPDNDEEKLLVRCVLISANDGKPPGTAFINTTYMDRYYNATGLRLPPGSLPGLPAKRPIVVYTPLDMSRMTITDAGTWRNESSRWENDDQWQDRDDGWSPPEQ